VPDRAADAGHLPGGPAGDPDRAADRARHRLDRGSGGGDDRGQLRPRVSGDRLAQRREALRPGGGGHDSVRLDRARLERPATASGLGAGRAVGLSGGIGVKAWRRVALAVFVWVVGITGAHLAWNVDWAAVWNDRLPLNSRKLNVAYIPVTC